MSSVVLNMVASMKMLDMNHYLMNPQLLEDLLAKLPIALRVQWSEYIAERPGYTLETFSRWLERRADAAGERIPFQPEKDTKKDPHDNKKKSVVAVTNEVKAPPHVKVTSHEVKPKPDTRPCDFCGDQHDLEKCELFKTLLSCDERWKFVSEKKLCFFCLKGGHRSFRCKMKNKKCAVENCGQRHHVLLHRVNAAANDSTPTQGNAIVPAQLPAPAQNLVGHTVVQPSRILMKILPVILSGPNGAVKTFAFLDEGSTLTLMKTDLANKLGLDGPTMSLRWHGTTHDMTSSSQARIVDVKIKGTFPGAKEYTLKRVRAIDSLALPRQSVNVEDLVRDWRYLSQQHVDSYEDAEPEILIGLDNIAVISSLEVIHGPWNAPYLARTLLGWVILGNVNPQADSFVDRSCAMIETIDELHEMVKQSFSLECFGASPQKDDTVRSRDDKKAIEIMERTTKRTSDGRYETGLLWRNVDPPNVPESKLQALKRLYSTEKKLDKNPELAKAYCEKMDDHIKKGYLVKLDDNDRQIPPCKTWYLPHFAVKHPAKNKIRIVFDCAAKSRGVCLNDLLLTGPDTLRSLPEVLMNFRRKKYGIMGDIREMFPRVKIRAEDQNYQRILWRGMNRDMEPEEYKVPVMTFGATCSPALAGYVKDLNAKTFIDEYPEAVRDILEHTYCDDFITCADSVEEARQRVEEVIKIHKNAGFDIVNWTANDPAILNSLEADFCSKLLNDSTNLERVLGLWWDPKKDAFTFKVNFHRVPAEILSGEKVPTKREVLRLVMSIFDPLGYLGLFTVKGKILLQNIWRQKIDWDDEIWGELMEDWSKFLAELYDIEKVSIPRCFSNNLSSASSIDLHIFGDASTSACAAAAYLVIDFQGEVETTLVASRTRVAPLKPETIPRMELHAATLSSRLGSAITSGLDMKIDNVHHWSDSMTVLHWLRNGSKKFKQFVSNRLEEIENLTELNSWQWVPSKSNAADLATRMIPCDFSSNSMWFTGPKFLKKPADEWPKEPQIEDSQMDDSEMMKHFINVQYENKRVVPYAENCSRWECFLRATAQVRNIALFWKEKALNKKRCDLPNLTVDDLEYAETEIWKDIQEFGYAGELRQLKKGKAVDPGSRLATYSPFVDDDGVLRMKSRLVNSSHIDEKFPIILDGKHHATRLLIMDAHVKNLHHGREQVVNQLRKKFRMPDIRSHVKKSWTDCQKCKNERAKPLPPEMAPLPKARVEVPIKVFGRTGVDFFGPIMVTVGRRQEKRWGVLFTCLATRAVHLEIAHSLSTSSAIQAIRRFNSRRGPCREFYSDNGTNLKGANTELASALLSLNQIAIQNTCTIRKIKWFFNPPKTPHMGGSWERMVRSVKTAMKTVLGSHTPDDEMLKTVFAECEYVVNNRPLTHVSVDPHDPVALTPNHFFFNEPDDNLPGAFDDKDLCLRKSWRMSQRITDMFWRRWVHEYLPELARRTKWYNDVPKLEVGSVVVIADETLPRNNWPLGIVEATYPGKDGNIRSASVRTARGTYKRPVAKICVLDVGATAPRGEYVVDCVATADL